MTVLNILKIKLILKTFLELPTILRFQINAFPNQIHPIIPFSQIIDYSFIVTIREDERKKIFDKL